MKKSNAKGGRVGIWRGEAQKETSWMQSRKVAISGLGVGGEVGSGHGVEGGGG